MSTSQRVVKNTLFLYVRTIVSLLVSVFTTRILLGTLGASDYGLYNVVGGSIGNAGVYKYLHERCDPTVSQPCRRKW